MELVLLQIVSAVFLLAVIVIIVFAIIFARPAMESPKELKSAPVIVECVEAEIVEAPAPVMPPPRPISFEERERNRRRAERRTKAQEKKEAAQRLREQQERQEKHRQRVQEAAQMRLDQERSLADWKQKHLSAQMNTGEVADEVGPPRRGRDIEVIAYAGPTRTILEWRVTGEWTAPPIVTAMCGKNHMFRECAFVGWHAAILATGRHVVDFWVLFGEPEEELPNLTFELFIVPAPAKVPNAFRQRVKTTKKDFIDRNKTLARAKRQIRDDLRARGADQDEIDLELARFEGEVGTEEIR